MDFALPPEIEDVRRRLREFVDQKLIPLEADRASYDEHENISPALLARMRAEAKAAGLWALQMPKSRGGGGLPLTGMAACYEEMNRSLFGPVVFNSAAPDDGNMIVLEKVATPAQKEKWLQPIVDGRVRSAFAMTEPDGCGSDPSLTYTRAERVGNTGWRVHGRKHYITGAGEAQHFILVARTSDDERKGLSAFLFPMVSLIGATATAVVLVIGGRLVFNQSLTIGELVLFIALIDRFFEPIRDLSQQYTVLQATMAAGERIFEATFFDELQGASCDALPAEGFEHDDLLDLVREAEIPRHRHPDERNEPRALPIELEDEERRIGGAQVRIEKSPELFRALDHGPEELAKAVCDEDCLLGCDRRA